MKRVRFPLYFGSEHPLDPIACVSTGRAKRREVYSGREFTAVHKLPADPPTQLSTQNSYR